MKKNSLKIHDEVITMDMSTMKIRQGRVHSFDKEHVNVEMYDVTAVNSYKLRMVRKINDK